MSMDGDNSAKAMEQGANSAMKDQDLTSGIHESTKQIVRLSSIGSTFRLQLTISKPAAGEKTTGTGTSMFDKDGAIGSMFKCITLTLLLPLGYNSPMRQHLMCMVID